MKRDPRLFVLRLASLLAIAALGTACAPADSADAAPQAPASLSAAPDSDASPPTVVVLVRHAEKVDDSRDPDLSEAGITRARELATMLADADFDHVWSTDFKRTRDTAGPTAQAASLETELYDPSDLSAFADQLLEMGGRHLVVGHSNTTPALVTALGGDPGSAIDDAEYDRLYVVSAPDRDSAVTTLLRFGVAYQP